MSLDDQGMSLVDHLTELRHRVIRSLQVIFVGMVLCLYFAPHILDVIRAPILPFLGDNNGLVFTGVMDKFMAFFKVGILSGAILTCPIWLYHVWKFISPGLYKNERRYAAAFIVSGTLLFLGGVVFVYYIVFPAAFEYLFNIGGNVDKPMITIDEYLSFFMLMTVMFGVAFEMPLILVFMALVGLFDASFLRKHRRVAVVIMALVAAILSPPDAMSMMFMWVPLLLFYEVAIIVIALLVKKRSAALDPSESDRLFK
ncbi:MAG TPA: twin-arginine translocase subunit TatC [Bdellovibrionales bacterium]|nr:twin-arginine translocase subunit TatC [Bdellovibrionales bacterium]